MCATMKAVASTLPLQAIPGGYGVPYFGAIKDRLQYFWFQGEEHFFQSRMDKYKSTVFRVNMPPGPPGFPDPRVVVLLDQKSFPTLFDMSKVEKRDVFTGTYVPDLKFTSGFRVCAYLDPSEERHTKLKTFCFEILKSNGRKFVPEFSNAIKDSFGVWEKALANGETASFTDECVQFAWNFLVRAIVHQDPVAPGKASLGKNGGAYATKWTGPQLAPIASVPLPHFLQELTIHAFPLPFGLVKKEYDAIFEFLDTYATDALDKAEALGLGRKEACANLLFFICFNAYGGYNLFFPKLMQHISECGNDGGKEIMKKLHEEVKAAVDAHGELSLKSLESMPLVKSVVYEGLRISPPVPYQYARAKSDFVLESHDASYQIMKGEVLFGLQPFVTKDPKVFKNPMKFIPDRFLGPEGEKLISCVFWSNGRETDSTSVHNKQCGGKDLVISMSRLFVAEMFQRYEEFTLTIVGQSPPQGSGVTITFDSLKRSSS